MADVSLCIAEFQWKYGDQRALELAREMGLSYVDFDLSSHSMQKENDRYAVDSPEEIEAYYTALRQYGESIGVRVAQTHGRIRAYRLGEPDFNEGQRLSARLDLLATRALGSRYCVMHAVHLGAVAAPEDQRSLNRQMFRDFLPFAQEYGVCIATETLGSIHTADGGRTVDFFGDTEEFICAYEEFKAIPAYAEHLCVCMDTGHTHRAAAFAGQSSCTEMIRRLGGAIECLHLNDNDGVEDMHLAPKMGTLDWQEVMKTLADIHYDGVYNMELKLRRVGPDAALQLQYARLAIAIMKSLLP